MTVWSNMFYYVTKTLSCSKSVIHVDNMYVISRTVALRDMQRYIFEWYFVSFRCNNFTLVCNIFTSTLHIRVLLNEFVGRIVIVDVY